MLHYDGKGNALLTEKEYQDAEFVVDFRFPAKKEETAECEFIFRSGTDTEVRLTLARDGSFKRGVGSRNSSEIAHGAFKDLKPDGQWNRLVATLTGISLKVAINGKPATELDNPAVKTKGRFGVLARGEMDFANLFVRELPRPHGQPPTPPGRDGLRQPVRARVEIGASATAPAARDE